MFDNSQMATLVLKRPGIGIARSYEILLDDQFLTHLKMGETKSIDILAGVHTLKARVFPFAQSKNVSFEIEANTSISFEALLSPRRRFQPGGWMLGLVPICNYLLIRFIAPSLGFKLTLLVLGLILTGILVREYWSRYRLCTGMIVRPIDVTALEKDI